MSKFKVTETRVIVYESVIDIGDREFKFEFNRDQHIINQYHINGVWVPTGTNYSDYKIEEIIE